MTDDSNGSFQKLFPRVNPIIHGVRGGSTWREKGLQKETSLSVTLPRLETRRDLVGHLELRLDRHPNTSALEVSRKESAWRSKRAREVSRRILAFISFPPVFFIISFFCYPAKVPSHPIFLSFNMNSSVLRPMACRWTRRLPIIEIKGSATRPTTDPPTKTTIYEPRALLEHTLYFLYINKYI